MTHVDGNALAGTFANLLGIEITTVIGMCRGCGESFNLARSRAFITAMGSVMRCNDCDGVLAVVVEKPGDSHVNLSGLAYLTVPRP